MSRQHPPSVIISGASTGIGKSCAEVLADRGMRVFAGYRKPEDAEALAALSERITPVPLDVIDPESIRQCVEKVREALGDAPLTGLVNNAGIVIGGPLEFLPLEDFRTQLEVNVTGQLAVTQAFLPMLRAAAGMRYKTRIVNMGSIAGLSSIPFAAPYSASKYALEALTDALRVELRPWRIGVSIIEPGVIATPIWEKSLAWADEAATRIDPQAFALYGRALEKFRAASLKSAGKGIPPGHVAKAVAHALTADAPRPRYLVGPDAWWRPLFATLPEPVKDWLLVKKIGLEGATS